MSADRVATEFEIPFTQYIRPDGRAKRVHLPVDKAVYEKANQIIEAGLSFEVENLMDGMVSATITDPDDGDLDICIGPNGPGMKERISAMILRFRIPSALSKGGGE